MNKVNNRIVDVVVSGKRYPVDLNLITVCFATEVLDLVNKEDTEGIVRLYQSLIVRMIGLETVMSMNTWDFQDLQQKFSNVIQIAIARGPEAFS